MKIITLLFFIIIGLFGIISLKNTDPGLISPSAQKGSYLASPTSLPTPSPSVTIGLVGDLGLGRHITATARSKNNFNWSFEKISPWLQENEINFANLESPIIADCPTGKTGTFTFCGDTRFLPYLKQNKLAFTLANNHIFNYGKDGFNQTKSYLAEIEVPHVYSHSPDSQFKLIEINGIKFGLLGYDFITNPNFDKNLIIDKVKQYDSQVDWLIVSLHWGNEYLPQPEKWRVTLAHQLVDAGADIIHGHHPHVWQSDEIYQGKHIFYSLGNFIFDQSWSYETSHTQIVRMILGKDKVLSEQKFPVEIRFNSQPAITASN